MDPIKNPFSPGAGAPPPELVGRDALLRETDILLGRVLAKRAEKSLLLTGLRGVGKTVLLLEMQKKALSHGYRTVFVEASEYKPLGLLLIPHLRRLLFELNRTSGAGQKVRQALAVLRSFVGGLKLTYGDVSISLDIEPEEGSADSGDLEIDLTNVFLAIGEAAEDRETGVALLIDELQYLQPQELGALIMAMHALQQRQLPMVLMAAGLPILPGLAGNAKSYAERLFRYPIVGALNAEDAQKALEDPAEERGVRFEPAAVEAIYDLSKGYPYFLQE